MIFGGNVPRGLGRLAVGKSAGIGDFDATRDGFAASLAPLIAFALVNAGLLAYQKQFEIAALALLSQSSMALALSVIIFEFAHRAHREEFWLRTATALNWSFWLAVPVMFLAALAGGLLVNAGLPERLVTKVMMGLIVVYLFWYHWFTVRAGLRLAGLPALGLVVLTNIVLCALAMGPYLMMVVPRLLMNG